MKTSWPWTSESRRPHGFTRSSPLLAWLLTATMKRKKTVKMNNTWLPSCNKSWPQCGPTASCGPMPCRSYLPPSCRRRMRCVPRGPQVRSQRFHTGRNAPGRPADLQHLAPPRWPRRRCQCRKQSWLSSLRKSLQYRCGSKPRQPSCLTQCGKMRSFKPVSKRPLQGRWLRRRQCLRKLVRSFRLRRCRPRRRASRTQGPWRSAIDRPRSQGGVEQLGYPSPLHAHGTGKNYTRSLTKKWNYKDKLRTAGGRREPVVQADSALQVLAWLMSSLSAGPETSTQTRRSPLPRPLGLAWVAAALAYLSSIVESLQQREVTDHERKACGTREMKENVPCITSIAAPARKIRGRRHPVARRKWRDALRNRPFRSLQTLARWPSFEWLARQAVVGTELVFPVPCASLGSPWCSFPLVPFSLLLLVCLPLFALLSLFGNRAAPPLTRGTRHSKTKQTRLCYPRSGWLLIGHMFVFLAAVILFAVRRVGKASSPGTYQYGGSPASYGVRSSGHVVFGKTDCSVAGGCSLGNIGCRPSCVRSVFVQVLLGGYDPVLLARSLPRGNLCGAALVFTSIKTFAAPTWPTFPHPPLATLLGGRLVLQSSLLAAAW